MFRDVEAWLILFYSPALLLLNYHLKRHEKQIYKIEVVRRFGEWKN